MRVFKIFNRRSEKIKRQYLRNRATDAEQILWYYLQGKQLAGYKFRRQYSIGKYVVDFYCPKLRLAIEIDGDTHFEKKVIEGDKRRQKFIELFGIQFLRFTNSDIYESINEVIEKILEFIDRYSPPSRKMRG